MKGGHVAAPQADQITGDIYAGDLPLPVGQQTVAAGIATVQLEERVILLPLVDQAAAATDPFDLHRQGQDGVAIGGRQRCKAFQPADQSGQVCRAVHHPSTDRDNMVYLSRYVPLALRVAITCVNSNR